MKNIKNFIHKIPVNFLLINLAVSVIIMIKFYNLISILLYTFIFFIIVDELDYRIKK